MTEQTLEATFDSMPDTVQFCKEGDARGFYLMLNKKSQEKLTFTDAMGTAEVKAQTVRIGHGVYGLSILKQLFNNLPDNTTFNLQSIKAVEDVCGTIPALKCLWTNHSSRGSWTLKSGVGVKFCTVKGDYKGYDTNTNQGIWANQRIKVTDHCVICRGSWHLLPNDWMASIKLM